MRIRLGAVSYLNTRPLVYRLEGHSDHFDVRFDVPSKCAALLHENAVDLGLIPSIEYLHGEPYRIVPGLSIASEGPVASVALFSKRPISEVRTIALDTSSRTSVALLKVLCANWFAIEPAFVAMAPDFSQMLSASDAALVIGDNALFADHESMGLEKIDLGEQWAGMTGLPFVYAFWAGRPGVAGPADVAALQQTRDEGLKATLPIARESFPEGPAWKVELADRYLREHIKYDLGEREIAGLTRFYELAARLGIVPSAKVPVFYESNA
jgi:chorismate dehydratase